MEKNTIIHVLIQDRCDEAFTMRWDERKERVEAHFLFRRKFRKFLRNKKPFRQEVQDGREEDCH